MMMSRGCTVPWLTPTEVVEIDATVAQQACTSLTAAGYTPTVITGDGTAGYPDGAPYDRIITTASVRPGELPYPWVTQTRPGGIIVTPWGPDYHNGVMAAWSWPRTAPYPDACRAIWPSCACAPSGTRSAYWMTARPRRML
ncbi:MAG: protein-L-isoaspartate O-methyltransferase family protein [Pseudonocardiaceae bacterium]